MTDEDLTPEQMRQRMKAALNDGNLEIARYWFEQSEAYRPPAKVTPTPRTHRPINGVSLEDVLVDVSHDITDKLTETDDAIRTHWTPEAEEDAEHYLHGVADGVRWLLAALLVGTGTNPNKVPITDELLEKVSGVMAVFGEDGTMCANIHLLPQGSCDHTV